MYELRIFIWQANLTCMVGPFLLVPGEINACFILVIKGPVSTQQS